MNKWFSFINLVANQQSNYCIFTSSYAAVLLALTFNVEYVSKLVSHIPVKDGGLKISISSLQIQDIAYTADSDKANILNDQFSLEKIYCISYPAMTTVKVTI